LLQLRDDPLQAVDNFLFGPRISREEMNGIIDPTEQSNISKVFIIRFGGDKAKLIEIDIQISPFFFEAKYFLN
jgi:hypothetical protein